MPCIRAPPEASTLPSWAREVVGRINKVKLRTIKLGPEQKTTSMKFKDVADSDTMYGCTCDGTCKKKTVKGPLHFNVKDDLVYCKKCFEAQQKKTKTTNTESDEEGKFVYCKTYKDVMKQIFNLMDEDGNGTISRSEFNKFFTAMGASQREIGMMFNVASPRANKQVMKKFFSDDDQDARNVKEDGLSLEEWADFYLKTFVFF
mmetsp:Transcript_3395/g.4198  ORF Transcript_3395/g.4198 Transcript_3395/m.4198 type:complete len:203 (+) Transcript_3395:80-688(+)|eukprot:jgi/Bigna1/90638/estExt_fgenesh1_pg.C_750052